MTEEVPSPDALITLLGHVSARLDTDIYLFSGPIESATVAQLMDSYPSAAQKANCALILTTYGGSPDAAFMLARFLKRKYSAGKFFVYIFGTCKSAGTLIAIGADEIVMAPHGELGPLDIQLAKEDSLWDRSSGLDIFAALGVLNTQAYAYFEHQFAQLLTRTTGQITTRTAADIATNIATQLLIPITAQIDPLRLGAMHRAVEITRQYGELLQPNRASVVERLITGYPSHAFVIDFDEAQDLFGCVREPDADESQLERTLRERLSAHHQVECVRVPHPTGIVECLTRAPATQRELPIHGDRNAAERTSSQAQPDSGAADRTSSTADAQDGAGIQRNVRPPAVGSATSALGA
jgi:Serine dehydrogenase proteinase